MQTGQRVAIKAGATRMHNALNQTRAHHAEQAVFALHHDRVALGDVLVRLSTKEHEKNASR